MKREVMEQWVSALRSGEYEQGFNVLRESTDLRESFCCLGVLCDLHRQSAGGGAWTCDGYQSGKNWNAEVPTGEVVSWAGLREPNPAIAGRKMISDLNDGEGKSFSEIADLIEQNWEAL